jgi:hypothetical protein
VASTPRLKQHRRRGSKTVNQRYRLILNPDISEGLDNLLLQTGDHLLLESGTEDVLLLQSNP